jgi:hypothetical protein
VTNVGGVGTSPKVIINTPAANFHNSGRRQCKSRERSESEYARG